MYDTLDTLILALQQARENIGNVPVEIHSFSSRMYFDRILTDTNNENAKSVVIQLGYKR